MFNKILLFFIIILIFKVYNVISISPFFEKGQRAEIFELMDNEVAVFNVTLPKREFAILKKTASVSDIGSGEMHIKYYEDTSREHVFQIRSIIEYLKETNFNNLYPGYNFNKSLKSLKIDNNGYPDINPDEILDGLNTNLKNYGNDDIFYENNEIFPLILLQSNNKNFNFLKIYSDIAQLNLKNISKIDGHPINKLFDQYQLLYYLIFYPTMMKLENMGIHYDDNTCINHIITTISKVYKNKNVDTIYDKSYLENILKHYNYLNNIIGNHDNNHYYKKRDDYDEEDIDLFDIGYYYKTKNATMSVKINGQQKEFEKITFSLGGDYSRRFSKPGFNLKIRGGKELYGRKQFKLRSDFNEATYMRSKLAADIHNRLGISSISANYITLYINNEYMGLYILMDSYKLSWVEYEYGEKDTTSLYNCRGPSELTENTAYSCVNENDDVSDDSEWVEFLSKLDSAQSASDIEAIFDIDHFLTEMALEYLFGSWDRFLRHGHNFYVYKQKNGQWKILSHDFDHDLGQDIDIDFRPTIYEDVPDILFNKEEYYYPNYSFTQWAVENHLIDILILNDSHRFDAILKKIVSNVFNPATLFPHIDELKEFIRPYVEKDKLPNKDGQYPGRINKEAEDFITLEQWDANIEFTSVRTPDFFGYGLKYWILSKYRYICKTYDMECDPVYMDDHYKYSVNKNVEFHGYCSSCSVSPSSVIEATTTTTTTTTTITSTVLQYKTSSIVNITPTSLPNNNTSCFSEKLGYPCCSPEITEVYYQDEDGDWGYDFDNNTWCGL